VNSVTLNDEVHVSWYNFEVVQTIDIWLWSTVCL